MNTKTRTSGARPSLVASLVLGGALAGCGELTETAPGATEPVARTSQALQADTAALGHLDGCSAASCWGWARDPDFTGSIAVHFYSPDATGLFTFRGAVTANLASEPGVGGSGAHRFNWTHNLPGLAFDAPVKAFAIGVDAGGAPTSANPVLSGNERGQKVIPRNPALPYEFYGEITGELEGIYPDWVDVPTNFESVDYTAENPQAYATFAKNGVTYTIIPTANWTIVGQAALGGAIKDGITKGSLGGVILGFVAGGIAGYVVGSIYAPWFAAVPNPADVMRTQGGLTPFRTSTGVLIFIPSSPTGN